MTLKRNRLWKHCCAALILCAASAGCVSSADVGPDPTNDQAARDEAALSTKLQQSSTAAGAFDAKPSASPRNAGFQCSINGHVLLTIEACIAECGPLGGRCTVCISAGCQLPPSALPEDPAR